MPGLREHLVQLIEASGPISLARYMAEALGHPKWGYYTTRDPLGRRGDFITAPEISQMFGELIGLWLATEWQRMGRPSPVRLVELGPGRGTLMVDALRSMSSVPGMPAAIDLHMVETSPALRQAQAEKLQATWHESIATLPEGPTLLVANEFFDALPVRQFERADGKWRERLVGLDAGNLVLKPGDPLGDDHFPGDAADGSIAETCDAAIEIAANLGAMLATGGGAALVIDYGYEDHAIGDTLQAVRDHEYAGVLDAPGECDLTAHVDFDALGKAFEDGGVQAVGPISQRAFLGNLGIRIRADALKQTASPSQRDDIESAVSRLIDKEQMGTLFKVMVVTDKGTPPPAGFGGHS